MIIFIMRFHLTIKINYKQMEGGFICSKKSKHF
mgnify:CR=1 FL=1